MEDVAAVLTPDKAVVTYRLASFRSRVIAHILDIVLYFGLLLVVSVVLSVWPMLGFQIGVENAVFNVLAVLGIFAFFILFEAYNGGQTPGKQVMGVRVCRADGTPVDLRAASIRNFLRAADFVPVAYVTGMAMMFLNARNQRFGDLIGDTIVINVPKFHEVFSPAPHKYGVHPLEPHVGSLRTMTLEEYVTLKRLCDRYPHLPHETQDQLTKEIWEPFAKRHRIPSVEGVHHLFLMEAVVMKFGRIKQLI